MEGKKRGLQVFFGGVLWGLLATSAQAHPAKTSQITLDLRDAGAAASVEIPADQLAMAFTGDTNAAPFELSADNAPTVAGYVADHFSLIGPDGVPWAEDIGTVSSEMVDGAPHIVVHLDLLRPPGSSSEALTLHYDGVLERLVSHQIFVVVRSDIARGIDPEHPEMAGILRYQRDDLTLDRASASRARLFNSLFALGARHIAEGADHLLFLAMLLLPAPLLVAGKRWQGAAPASVAVRHAAYTATAFTVGHSLTLALGAIGGVTLPSQLVESLIAVSILVSAVHALRPIFPGREPYVAAGFGLIHGLAFATILSELGLDGFDRVLGLLAFNLGLEAVQLVVIAAAMPALTMIARTRAAAPVRIIGATLGGIAALGWLVERLNLMRNPLESLGDPAMTAAPYGLAALPVVALVLWLKQRQEASAS